MQADDATLECSACHTAKPPSAFTEQQLDLGDARRCPECTRAARENAVPAAPLEPAWGIASQSSEIDANAYAKLQIWLPRVRDKPAKPLYMHSILIIGCPLLGRELKVTTARHGLLALKALRHFCQTASRSLHQHMLQVAARQMVRGSGCTRRRKVCMFRMVSSMVRPPLTRDAHRHTCAAGHLMLMLGPLVLLPCPRDGSP